MDAKSDKCAKTAYFIFDESFSKTRSIYYALRTNFACKYGTKTQITGILLKLIIVMSEIICKSNYA